MEKLYDVPLKLNCMCLRGDGKKGAKGIYGTCITTDTYYGCFPCEPYAENTTLQNICVCAEVKGVGRAELHCLTRSEDKTVAEVEFINSVPEVLRLSFSIKNDALGCLYLKLTGELEVYQIWYEGESGEADESIVRETKIAILICTFRREKYLQKNLQKLSRTIERDDILKNCIKVFCVDNGGTLSVVPNGIKLIKNRNYGGSGGYARGMLEAREKETFTHFWMMDDDIQFDPSILRRALIFMKYRKQDDIRLAAGMFSFEAPTIQVEATAIFNGYTFTSNASGLDFRSRESLFNNRIRNNDYIYGGWWSLIIPVAEDLPMPFFIKMDDIEFGIRTRGKYVVMNGYGVWHEAFGKKGSAWPEYYTTRNTLIVQNMYPELPHSSVKMMGIRLLKALAYGEPKCMEAAYKGVQDYLIGYETFKHINPVEKHKQVLVEFKAPLVSNMTRKKMLKSALKNLWKPGSCRSIGLYLKTVKMLRVRPSDDWKELCTEKFWRDYLGLV